MNATILHESRGRIRFRLRQKQMTLAQVGVDDFRAGVLPADKAEYVARLRREGHTVLMVGDGINDSPALSEADAGIATSYLRHIAQCLNAGCQPAEHERITTRQKTNAIIIRRGSQKDCLSLF